MGAFSTINNVKDGRGCEIYKVSLSDAEHAAVFLFVGICC